MIFACVANDGKISVIIFEKADRLTGICYVQVLNDVKIRISQGKRLGKPNKITKNVQVTFQQDGALCHTSAVALKISQG